MTITINIDEENNKEKTISFDTLMTDFDKMFEGVKWTDLFYKPTPGGFFISFTNNDILLKCNVTYGDIVDFYTKGRAISSEDVIGLIKHWVNTYLVNAIKEE